MEMKTVMEIINREGGIEKLKHGCYEGHFYIKIENGGYMPLIIEYVGDGPQGHALISVSHNYIQEGDVMRDPEIVFIVVEDKILKKSVWTPKMFQQDNLGIYQEIIFQDEKGIWKVRNRDLVSCQSFAKQWDKNLKAQGFLNQPNTIKEEVKEVA